MLAYHDSVFLLFAVEWFAFASECTGRILKEMDSLFGQFLLVFLIFPGASLFNFAIVSHLLYKWLS